MPAATTTAGPSSRHGRRNCSITRASVVLAVARAAVGSTIVSRFPSAEPWSRRGRCAPTSPSSRSPVSRPSRSLTALNPSRSTGSTAMGPLRRSSGDAAWEKRPSRRRRFARSVSGSSPARCAGPSWKRRLRRPRGPSGSEGTPVLADLDDATPQMSPEGSGERPGSQRGVAVFGHPELRRAGSAPSAGLHRRTAASLAGNGIGARGGPRSAVLRCRRAAAVIPARKRTRVGNGRVAAPRRPRRRRWGTGAGWAYRSAG
jgi:hypothetical protein